MRKFFFNKFTIIVVVLLLIAGAFFVGRMSGESKVAEIEKVLTLSNKEEGKPEGVDFAAFWKAWNVLNERYVSTKEAPGDQEKVWGAIQGLASSLGDPYTVFFPPVENKLFETEISGNFEGVGMEVATKNGILTVVAPLKGSPAERS
jgi:carboxyl-terminal processing protease